MSEENEPIEKRIIKWLDNQGYPLEMFVAQSFQKAGFQVIQSSFYEDPETGKLREVDVRAWLSRSVEQSGRTLFMSIGCDIECKFAQDKPWLLFTSEDQTEPWLGDVAVGSKIGEWLLNGIAEDQKNQGESQIALAGFPRDRTAYGITQAFTSGLDVPYQAITSIFKAATINASEFDRNNKIESKGKTIFLSVIFPVVVIDSRLFECYLDNKGQLVVGEVQSGIFACNFPIANYFNPVIHICSKSALHNLIQNVAQAADTLKTICAEPRQFNDLIRIKKELFKGPTEISENPFY